MLFGDENATTNSFNLGNLNLTLAVGFMFIHGKIIEFISVEAHN